MNHGSLFSGIGGFDLAAEWMGWTNIFQVEWDKWCRKVLAKNFPDTLRFGDIVEFNKMLQNGKICTNAISRRRWTSKNRQICRNGLSDASIDILQTESETINIPRIDILTGGFPCQPFSHAGKRKGTDDSRYLWPAMFETIRILKPSFIVGENVAGLTSMENDTPFEKWVQIGMESKNYIRRKYSRYIYRKRQSYILNEIIEDLEKENYTVETFIIPACGVGAWHRRDRIWIVGRNQIHTNSNGIRSRKIGTYIESGKTGNISNDIRQMGKDVPNTNIQGSQGRNSGELQKCTKQQPVRKGNSQNNGSYWEFEPDVGRVAHGISNRVDRLKGLGNAIVPQVAFELFKAIEMLKR